MKITGAGGTEGGIGRFFIGLAMMIGGGYLFLDGIKVTNSFDFGYTIFALWGYHVTSGMVLVPFIFGIALIFYDAKNLLGWILAASTIVMLGLGVISGLHFRLRPMSAFELLMIIGLFTGGLGLFLSSLRRIA